MGKVIKKGTSDLATLSSEPTVGDSPLRRAPIIEKDTFEARSQAQEIIEKAEKEAQELAEEGIPFSKLPWQTKEDA